MATALTPPTACVVPTPSQLAALGTVLCLHRSGAARELGGWSSARLAQRIRGGAWEASVLRFQSVPAAPEEGGPMLVASLGTLSPLGIDCARRIARGNGITPSSSLDDCCCRRAAAAARTASPDAYRHLIHLS